MDIMNRIYRAAEAMQPVADIGYFVKIRSYKQNYWRRVYWYEAIPPFQFLNMGALAAQTAILRQNATNLAVLDDDFGQFRWCPLDPIEVGLYLPSGVAKWQLRNIQVRVAQDIIYRDPLLVSTELGVWEDEWPSFDARNFSDYALNASRLIGFGFRFKTEKVTALEEARLQASEDVKTYKMTLSQYRQAFGDDTPLYQFTTVPCGAEK